MSSFVRTTVKSTKLWIIKKLLKNSRLLQCCHRRVLKIITSRVNIEKFLIITFSWTDCKNVVSTNTKFVLHTQLKTNEIHLFGTQTLSFTSKFFFSAICSINCKVIGNYITLYKIRVSERKTPISKTNF